MKAMQPGRQEKPPTKSFQAATLAWLVLLVSHPDYTGCINLYHFGTPKVNGFGALDVFGFLLS